MFNLNHFAEECFAGNLVVFNGPLIIVNAGGNGYRYCRAILRAKHYSIGYLGLTRLLSSRRAHVFKD